MDRLSQEKTRLNRCPSEQRTLHCYIEKGKTEPFPIWTENSALLHRKRQDSTVPHRKRELCIVISKKTRLNCSPYQQRTLHCYIEKNKTEPFPIPKENSILLARKRPDWTVPHSNTEHTRLTFAILSKINVSNLGWFLIAFWPIFEGNHFESIPKVRLACICIFHIHLHTRVTLGVLSKITTYIYTWGLEKRVHHSARFLL